MSNELTVSQQNLLANPSAVGTIEAYISAVQRIPMLSEEREKFLGEALKTGDVEAARELVLSHLRLVVSISRQYLGYGLPYADLIQEGTVGLMKAVKRFDVDRGVRLVSFAMHWIKAEIHEYIIRNWRLVRVATTKAQRKLFFNLRSLRPDGQNLSLESIQGIAEKLNVRPEDVVEMEVRMTGSDTSFDLPVVDEDNAVAPVYYLTGPDTYEPDTYLENQSRTALATTGITNALEQLDDRSRRIVESRWLHDEDQHAVTLHELADEYGVSAERIRQIEVAALKKMKKFLS